MRAFWLSAIQKQKINKNSDEDLFQFKTLLTFVKLLSQLPPVCEILKLNTKEGDANDKFSRGGACSEVESMNSFSITSNEATEQSIDIKKIIHRNLLSGKVFTFPSNSDIKTNTYILKATHATMIAENDEKWFLKGFRYHSSHKSCRLKFSETIFQIRQCLFPPRFVILSRSFACFFLSTWNMMARVWTRQEVEEFSFRFWFIERNRSFMHHKRMRNWKWVWRDWKLYSLLSTNTLEELN